MEHIRPFNPIATPGSVNPAPSVRGNDEPMVPVASDGLDLQGVAAPIQARPVLVPLTLAQQLVSVPSLGLHVAGSASGLPGAGLRQVTLPTVSLSAANVPLDPTEQANKAIADIVTHSRPELASVKVALFQTLRKQQPAMTPDDIHAANQFIEASRTPQEMGARLLSLANLYRAQPTMNSAHLNAIQHYADSAPTPEESVVRLWGLANMLKGGPEVTPGLINGVSATLADVPTLTGRDLALEHIARGRGGISGQGVPAFIDTIFNTPGDRETQRDLAYQIARENPQSFG